MPWGIPGGRPRGAGRPPLLGTTHPWAASPFRPTCGTPGSPSPTVLHLFCSRLLCTGTLGPPPGPSFSQPPPSLAAVSGSHQVAISSAVYSTRGIGSPLWRDQQPVRAPRGQRGGLNTMLAGCVASASCLTALLLDFLGCDLGTLSHTVTTVPVKVVVLVTNTFLPCAPPNPQVWCEAVRQGLIPAEAPVWSLLLVLEGYLGNQLPALAVHLVREALAAEDAPVRGPACSSLCPSLPQHPRCGL